MTTGPMRRASVLEALAGKAAALFSAGRRARGWPEGQAGPAGRGKLLPTHTNLLRCSCRCPTVARPCAACDPAAAAGQLLHQPPFKAEIKWLAAGTGGWVSRRRRRCRAGLRGAALARGL